MDSLTFDLARQSLRELNQFLHGAAVRAGEVQRVVVSNPDGAHNIAVGLDSPIEVEIQGHAGYYAGGMNKAASITITGSAGTGVAENMMSGKVHVKGFASNGAGASAHGGLLVIEGDAGLRCGISLKGGDIVVGGSVGSFSADKFTQRFFFAQRFAEYSGIFQSHFRTNHHNVRNTGKNIVQLIVDLPVVACFA